MSFTRRTKRLKSRGKRFKPKKYQTACIGFGVERPEAGFFLAPGLGKTMIILMIFRILKRLGLIDELLVVAKRKIIYNVWPQEIRKWRKTRHLTHSIVHGSKKLDALWADTDVKLINYEGLEWLKEQKKWFRRGKRVMLACDESSKLRHTKTVRFRSLKKILPKFERRYIMTGSPAPNGLMGLFGQVYALDLGETFGKFISYFRNEYFYPAGYMGYDWKPIKGAEKRIFKKLRPLVMRFGDKELDMPPLVFVDRKIDLSPKVMKLYKKLEKEFLLEFDQGDIVADNAATATGKLRQIANGGCYYSSTGEIVDERNPRTGNKSWRRWRTIHEEKCAELVDLLEELNGEPAFVAFEFEHDKIRLQRYLKKHAPQFAKAPFIDGKTKDAKATRYMERWNKGKYPVLFGQTSVCAHGLNLQGKGGIVIYFALTWNLEDYEQFYRRIWRQGQKRRVIVYRLVARNTVDETMVYSLRAKDRTQQALLRAMEGSNARRKKRTPRKADARKERRKRRRWMARELRTFYRRRAQRLRKKSA
jgi:SNF2 family DNA or RNA helicase